MSVIKLFFFADIASFPNLYNHTECRGGGTGGARGATAPPIFGGQRNKIPVEFCAYLP